MNFNLLSVGVLLIIGGIITLTLTIRYIVKDYKKENMRFNFGDLIAFILELFWYPLMFTTLFLYVGLGAVIFGILFIIIGI